MSTRTLSMTDDLYAYYRDTAVREPAVLAGLREKTAAMPNGGMQISPEQGRFMRLLASIHGTRRALEIGTFTGYSSLCVAMSLPPAPEGCLVCCDASETYTAMAREAWESAGLSDRITLKLGDARQTLADLIAGKAADARGRGLPGPGRFDQAFIDADKTGYDAYYEACLELVRPGGLILIDNVLWHGQLAEPASEDEDADTRAIRAINRKVFSDGRVEACMLPIGDGLTIARKL